MISKTKARSTNEEARPTLVPKLRFPEFRGAEGWEYSPLGKLLMKSPDYGVNAAAVPFTEGLPQYLRITDISDDGTYLSTKKVSVDLTPTEEIFLDEGDIVLARTGASVGKSYRYRKEDGRLVFAGFLIRVRPNSKRLDSTYLANFLTTNQYWKWVAATSARSGQPGINSVEYGSLEIPLPAEFAEQQKIAECLSSVDELMAAQARKVDALKTHKKGLMQQLFPREGETQPRLRFPEFQNAGEWVEDTLDDIATFRRGSFPQPYGLPEWYDEKNGMPFIQVFDVGDNFRLKDKTKNKISKLGAEKSVFIPEGTLIVTLQGSIGRVAITHYDAYIDRTLLIFESFQKPIEKVFFSRVIQNLFDIEKEKAPGGIIKTITKESLSGFKVKYPKIDEQQRIASCLSSLDALITAETQKHEALKTHKKGLMQQLFPSPEEIES